MGRKIQKRRRRLAPRRPASPSFDGPKFLLIIDNKPIHRRALADYLASEKRVAGLREQIEVFDSGDLPAYHRWEAQLFGSLLTEIRELESAAAEKRRLLDAVEQEIFWTGCSRVVAYRRVMAALNRPPEADEDEIDTDADRAGGEDFTDSGERLFGDSDLPPGFDIDSYERMPKAAKAEFRTFYELMSTLFEAMTGGKAPTLEEALERERARRRGEPPSEPDDSRPDANPASSRRRSSDSLRASAPPPVDERLKTLYRDLVRKLHPDRNRNIGWRERELWHEVQAAYRERDLERLEAAAGRLEVGLNGASLALPIQILRRMTQDLRQMIAGLKRELSRARKHPAWKFAARAGDLPALEDRHRRQLETAKNKAAADLRQLEAILDDLSARASRPRRRRKSRTTQQNPQQMSWF